MTDWQLLEFQEFKMIESPKNFIEQFQNFIEHIAGVMKTFLTKEDAKINL